jgi:hypothetical protein
VRRSPFPDRRALADRVFPVILRQIRHSQWNIDGSASADIVHDMAADILRGDQTVSIRNVHSVPSLAISLIQADHAGNADAGSKDRNQPIRCSPRNINGSASANVVNDMAADIVRGSQAVCMRNVHFLASFSSILYITGDGYDVNKRGRKLQWL